MAVVDIDVFDADTRREASDLPMGPNPLGRAHAGTNPTAVGERYRRTFHRHIRGTMPRHSTRPKNSPPRVALDVESMRSDQRERRDRVIAATMRLMVDVDYDEIQIRDVADESGVALGTLYRYFTSKEHIFACALLEWGAGTAAPVAPGDDMSAVERVKTLFLRAARAFERQPRVYDVVMRLHASKEPEIAALWGEFARRQSEAFAAALGDVPLPQRDDIVSVMGAVLSEAVRSRRLGVITEQEVHRRIDRAAELILGAAQ